MKRIVVIILAPFILVIGWFYFHNKFQEIGVAQDGIVSFDFNGQNYAISGTELLIYGTSHVDRDQIIEIPNGQRADFHFAILSSLKKKNELKNKDKDWLAKNWYNAYISWDESQLRNPEFLATYKINKTDEKGLYMSFILPGYGLISDNPMIRDEWVQIDRISQGRAQGHFGGTFEEPKNLQSIQVENGTFNVPVEKLYKYK